MGHSDFLVSWVSRESLRQQGVSVRIVISLVLCLACFSCTSIERLVRNSPWGPVEERADRVNAWPLYHQNADKTAVLWPVFDQDDRGFALRPLITRDKDDWELLWPLSWWDAETGEWRVLSAYSYDMSYGVVPMFGVGEFSYIGPAWWEVDDEGAVTASGVFPVAGWREEFSHVGPAWWSSETLEDSEEPRSSFGLFPVFSQGHDFNNLGTVFWGYNAEDEMNYFVAFPAVGFGEGEDGSGMFLTALGGRGWDEKGDTTFVNVLGPLYHHQRDGDVQSTSFLWPLFAKSDGPEHSRMSLWPLIGRDVERSEEGETTLTSTTSAMGLFRHAAKGSTVALRLLPLFSHRNEDGDEEDLIDWLSLYGYKKHADGDTAIPLGTPMMFSYQAGAKDYRWHSLFGTIHYEARGDVTAFNLLYSMAFHYRGVQEGGKDYRWSSLLGAISYEEEEDRSEFNLLYYLYRQKTEGTETSRDLFPFITWDSGDKRSGVSFLWRLFSWERNGDRVSGHAFFIPWGDK
jgi:hypothetical protein